MRLALQIIAVLAGWLAIFAGLLLLAAFGMWFSSQPWAGVCPRIRDRVRCWKRVAGWQMTLEEDTATTAAEESLRLSREIGKLLAGRGPQVQGAALADVVSMWLAGHRPPSYRAILLKHWLRTVLKLIPASEAEILERHGPGKGKPN